MTTLHVIASAVQDPVQAAGILHTIRNAVIIFLLIVFLAGAIVGFLLARLIYRRSDSASGTSGAATTGTTGTAGSGFRSGTAPGGMPPSPPPGQRRRANRPR